jgi:hypothetical protein
MWLADLAEFKEAWNTYKEARELDMEVGGSTEVVKKGKKTAATKKTTATATATATAIAKAIAIAPVPSNTIVEPLVNKVIDPSVKTVTVGTTVKLQRKQTVVNTTKA